MALFQLAALAGTAALVTGASSGLGRATAIALAHAGADLALLARSAPELELTAADVRSAGQRALVLAVDLARDDEVLNAVEHSVREFGRLDILVNAAATDVPRPVVDLAVAELDRVIDVKSARAICARQGRVPAHAHGRAGDNRQRLFGRWEAGLGERRGILRL